MKFTERDVENMKLDASRISDTTLKNISYRGDRTIKGNYTRKYILEEIVKILEAKV